LSFYLFFFVSFRSAGALDARTGVVNKKAVVPAKGTTADYFAVCGPKLKENLFWPGECGSISREHCIFTIRLRVRFSDLRLPRGPFPCRTYFASLFKAIVPGIFVQLQYRYIVFLPSK
jgi:hypothetical protein